MATLHLNLKGVYYREIQAGTKLYEYRLRAKWEKRISGKRYTRILIKLGYPAAGDKDRIIERPWRGYEIQTITHPHFGDGPVEVLAIRVN